MKTQHTLASLCGLMLAGAFGGATHAQTAPQSTAQTPPKSTTQTPHPAKPAARPPHQSKAHYQNEALLRDRSNQQIAKERRSIETEYQNNKKRVDAQLEHESQVWIAAHAKSKHDANYQAQLTQLRARLNEKRTRQYSLLNSRRQAAIARVNAKATRTVGTLHKEFGR